MDLSTLNNLGLPGWVLIVAVLVFILNQVGVFKYAYNRLTDTSEHKQQSEDRQTEHLQKSQSDALSSSLNIANRVIDHIIETSNSRMGKIEDKQGQIIGILRKVEGQQAITNRDWSKMEEILSDIDVMLHEIKTSLSNGRFNPNESRQVK